MIGQFKYLKTLFFIFLQRLAFTQTLTTIFSKYHFFGYKWTKNSQKITNQDIKILFVASFSAFLKLLWTMANSISIKGELGPIFPGSVIYTGFQIQKYKRVIIPPNQKPKGFHTPTQILKGYSYPFQKKERVWTYERERQVKYYLKY